MTGALHWISWLVRDGTNSQSISPISQSINPISQSINPNHLFHHTSHLPNRLNLKVFKQINVEKKEDHASIATSQTTHRQTVITSRRSPSEESYLFQRNYVLTATVQITERRSAAALRNVHISEGDNTLQSARTSLDTKNLSNMIDATGKSSVTYPLVVVEVCGIRCRALPDTGAGSSYASEALLDRIGKQLVRKEFRNIEMLM